MPVGPFKMQNCANDIGQLLTLHFSVAKGQRARLPYSCNNSHRSSLLHWMHMLDRLNWEGSSMQPESTECSYSVPAHNNDSIRYCSGCDAAKGKQRANILWLHYFVFAEHRPAVYGHTMIMIPFGCPRPNTMLNAVLLPRIPQIAIGKGATASC